MKELIGKSLYRFRPCTEQSFLSLLRHEIYASTPDLFNDPYDGAFSYDTELTVQFLKDEGIYELFLERYVPRGRTIEEVIAFVCGEAEAKWRKTCLVSCFCEDCTKEMMWAHYADSGRGFAVRYDASKIIDALGSKHHRSGLGLHKVRYRRARSVFTIYLCRLLSMGWPWRTVETDDLFWLRTFPSLFLEKNICWREEKEWRVVLENADKRTTAKPILFLKPEGIVLGEHITRLSRFILCSIANRESLPVSEIVQSHEKGSFGYIEKPLSPQEIAGYVNRLGATIGDLYDDALADMNLESREKRSIKAKTDPHK